jgi:endonuclease III
MILLNFIIYLTVRTFRNLKKIAGILKNNYDADIPQTYVELCKLPGIGPKMALIALHSVR